MTQLKKLAAFWSMMTHTQYVTTQEQVNNNIILRHIVTCHVKKTSKGLLCGECKEGYGVGLLSNQCKKFTDIVPQFWLFPIYRESIIDCSN